MMMNISDILPSTTERVAINTCSRVNKEIRDRTIERLRFYKNCCGKTLTQRIKELDKEWDTERTLETNASAVVLISSVMGYKKTKCCYFLITGMVGACLLYHALQGWCPSLPVIRNLGIRTEEEIYNEKSVIKHIRGDFSHNTKNADELLSAVEKK